MGKYSEFARRAHDAYQTPYDAALPLRNFLTGIRNFAEPCRGEGRLVRHVESFGPLCIHDADIQEGIDALRDPVLKRTIVDAIITNPPYTWSVLEPMLKLFPTIAPTWLLLEADFSHNKRCAPFMWQCTDIVSIGRIKWFDDTPHEGKTNYGWYRFHAQHTRGPMFHPRQTINPLVPPAAVPAAA